MRGAGRLGAALALAALVWGCAPNDLARSSRALTPTPAGQVVVEVLRGFEEAPDTRPLDRVELLVDVSSSMRAQTPGGVPGSRVAALLAARLLEALPASTGVGVSALGTRSGECRASQALAHSPPGSPRDTLLTALEAVEPVSEGSLAAALDLIGAGMGAQAHPQRLVVFTDLGRQCGGNLCQAVAALVDDGVALDLVVVGDAGVPDCVERFVLEDALDVLPPPAPSFRVESRGARGPVLLASGLADGSPIRVPAGNAHVVIGLEPEAEMGPVFFPPAALTRVRVLDFPHLGRGVREWRWDTLAAPEPGAKP